MTQSKALAKSVYNIMVWKSSMNVDAKSAQKLSIKIIHVINQTIYLFHYDKVHSRKHRDVNTGCRLYRLTKLVTCLLLIRRLEKRLDNF